jgi:membrane dipeptidase
MPIIDAHCDVLSKLYGNPKLDFGDDESGLDVTLPKLQASRVMLQMFAVWLPEHVAHPRIGYALRCIDLFHTHILRNPSVMEVRSKRDLAEAAATGKVGAMLSLEGADVLEGDFSYLRTLFRLGVRALGITWNFANWAADGVHESRNGGFTIKGRELVKECDRLGILLDASHLSENGFWELAELSERPFYASHSNAYTVCPHIRNLKDDQIEYLIRSGGRMGLNFFPPFVHEGPAASIHDLLRHIDHVCSLGGAGIVGLGSDFDGIDKKLADLAHAGEFDRLINALQQRFKEDEVEGFLYRNWYGYLNEHLPER